MDFLNTVNQFISGKEYANKGIRTKDGKLAYVTATGVTKQFASLEDAKLVGENCPNEFVDVDQTWKNLGFPIGSLMVNGQSCGNEGKYVRVEPPETNFDWQFYLKSNQDLASAGLTTEQQVTDHWNNYGKSEGRVPNATIFSSMGALGNVGYVDVDTAFHSVQPNYTNTYKDYPNQSNITGTDMKDCSTLPPFLKYGEPVVFMQDNRTGFLNSASVLKFGKKKTNLFLRPPPGDDRGGRIIKSGDTICISSSSSSYTDNCGWWGCKVGKINEQNQLVFGSGGETPQQFIIFSISVPQGAEIRLDYPFIMVSIPQSNKARLPLNASVSCKSGQPNGMPSGIYRYSGTNELNYYPTGDIANSWNTNWGSVHEIDCKSYTFGDTITKKNTANLNVGKAVACHAGKELPKGVDGGIYRYVDENILRWYPSPTIANRWDTTWTQFSTIDCSTYKAGPPISEKFDGIGKDLVEPYKIGFVKNGITLFASFGEVDFATAAFSLQTNKHNNSCDVGKLKNICNDTPDCIGFVQATANNSWQMITPNSTSRDYKITGTVQDVYLKEANVNLLDDSCEPGPISFIKGSVLQNYPQGKAFVHGQGNCKVIKAPTGKVSNHIKISQEIVDNFPIIKNDSSTRIQMKEKTNEYREVLDTIKKMEPSITLEQQYMDMTVFDGQNKMSLILWSVVSVTILGVVLFRMKS